MTKIETAAQRSIQGFETGSSATVLSWDTAIACQKGPSDKGFHQISKNIFPVQSGLWSNSNRIVLALESRPGTEYHHNSPGRYDPFPMAERPMFSIIIVSLNGRDRIAMPLDALARSESVNKTHGITSEIIIVDNGSDDGLSSHVQENFQNIRLIRSPENLGFAGGNNLGMINARGKILVLLNDDTEPEPDWLVPFYRAFSSDPKLGIAGCKLLYPDRETIQHMGGYLEDNGLSRHADYGVLNSDLENESDKVDYVTGAAFAIHRNVIRQTGLLDEWFWPIYFEETDFCERAKKSGWKIAMCSDSVVIHHESMTTEKYSPRFLKMYHRNRWRFLMKNRKGTQWLKTIRAELRWITENRLWDQFLPLCQAYAWAAIQWPRIARLNKVEGGRR